MGSLSNLYISQSYTSLAHLGTNNSLVAGTMTQLQDGIGQSLNISFDGTNISSSGNIYAANITGSGGATINTGSFVSTSSFNSYTQSTNIRLNNLESTSASVNVSVSNLNSTTSSFATSIANLNTTTASLNTSVTNLNTFTASQSTASIVTSINNLNTFSASALVSISNLNTTTASLNTSVTNLNATSASQQVSINSLNSATASYVTETESGSFLITASVNVNVLTFTKGNGTTFNLTVAASGSVTPGTISGSAQITALGFVSSSVTASSLITASFNNGTRNLTFTKGDASTFAVNIPDVSGSTINTGSFATTGSNQFNGNQSISGSVTLSGSMNNVDYIDFNTASATPAWKSGRVFWDNTDGCLAVYNVEQDITLQVGQENWTRVFNDTGATITNGRAVRLSGTHGDVPEIVLAQSIAISGSVNTTNQILGIATHDIETGTYGYITTQGLVRGLNTNTFTDGSTLFVSQSAGLLTTIPPTAPYELIPIGVCVKASPGASGIIYVSVQQPIDFSDLSSVLVTGSYSNGDMWQYVGSGATGNWRHNTIAQIGLVTTSSFNAYTASTDSSISQLNASTASQQISIDNINLATASFSTTVNGLSAKTGSYATTGSNSFNGSQIITGSVTASLDIKVNSLTIGLGGGQIGTNLAFGSASLQSNTTGINNVGIGSSTLQNNTANNNVAIGTNALQKNIAALGNVAIGGNALQSQIFSGNGYNIAIGANVLQLLGSTTASQAQLFGNTVIGGSTGQGMTIGARNTIIGASAFQGADNVQRLTGIGRGVFSGIGSGAVNNGSGSQYNTAIGHNALFSLQSGSNNTVIHGGSNAGEGFITGSNNTVLGEDSNLVPSMESNTIIGRRISGLTSPLANAVILADGAGNKLLWRPSLNATTQISSSIDISGSLNVNGSLTFTGSSYGNVVALSVTSNTASIDLSTGNYFTLLLPTNSATNLNVTNVRPGVTATLVLSTDTASSASFSYNVKQPSGSLYYPSNSGSTDIITFAAVNSTTIYAVSVLKMI
jgi:hypothetical protein